MTWEEIKASLDRLAALRGHKPVDQILAENAIDITPRLKLLENKPQIEGQKVTRVASERVWWNKDEQ